MNFFITQNQMKMKTVLLLIIIIVLYLSKVYAQEQSYYGIHSPDHFQKVYFVISITNNNLIAGSNSTLQIRVDNASTNKCDTVGPCFSGVHYIDGITLTNSAGKCYQLIPNERFNGPNYGSPSSYATRDLYPGKNYEWVEAFEVSRDVEPGDYKLNATLHIFTNNSEYSWILTSNPLDVRVTR
jgi:hypothetical protein